jgi:hypothetical protein
VPDRPAPPAPDITAVRAYWNRHIHDLAITSHPVGSPGFFAVLDECRRVLKPGGIAFFQVYGRVSWLHALSRVMKVGLEHEDAPVLRTYTVGEFRRLLRGCSSVRIVPERCPVRSRLHGGWKGALYNNLFVGTFNAIPRPLVRRCGWHLLAFCPK